MGPGNQIFKGRFHPHPEGRNPEQEAEKGENPQAAAPIKNPSLEKFRHGFGEPQTGDRPWMEESCKTVSNWWRRDLVLGTGAGPIQKKITGIRVSKLGQIRPRVTASAKKRIRLGGIDSTHYGNLCPTIGTIYRLEKLPDFIIDRSRGVEDP
jgi:hypothetical protein